jgi:error-prone DNA polymerase
MIEIGPDAKRFCNQCAHAWIVHEPPRRFRSIDELVRLTGMRRDEITVLAEIGALNSLGHDRRSALWQAERAVRPPGELFVEADEPQAPASDPQAPGPKPQAGSPLPPMTATEQLVSDYAGTGLTIGKHPMSFRRQELSLRGVLRAMDLPGVRGGRRVRAAGMVITRQRPGTAKGFVFLTLEDETGIANIIIRPDLYDSERLAVVESPFLLIEGILQNQDGVTSIKAEQVLRLEGFGSDEAFDSHDFH